MRIRIALVLLGGALAFFVGAWSVSGFVQRDRDVGLTDLQVKKLKNEARKWSNIPPIGGLQVIEADPATADDHDFPNGVVVWRTAFGIDYGRTETYEGQSHTDWQFKELTKAWLVFLVLELTMLGPAFVLLFLEWRTLEPVPKPVTRRPPGLNEIDTKTLARAGAPPIRDNLLAGDPARIQENGKEKP